jgi:hypothetical protein
MPPTPASTTLINSMTAPNAPTMPAANPSAQLATTGRTGYGLAPSNFFLPRNTPPLGIKYSRCVGLPSFKLSHYFRRSVAFRLQYGDRFQVIGNLLIFGPFDHDREYSTPRVRPFLPRILEFCKRVAARCDRFWTDEEDERLAIFDALAYPCMVFIASRKAVAIKEYLVPGSGESEAHLFRSVAAIR